MRAWKESEEKEKNMHVERKLENFSFNCGWKERKSKKNERVEKTKRRGKRRVKKKKEEKEWNLEKILLLASFLKSYYHTFLSYKRKKKSLWLCFMNEKRVMMLGESFVCRIKYKNEKVKCFRVSGKVRERGLEGFDLILTLFSFQLR